MDAYVFLAMLAAALCHAAWNAGLKARIDPAIAITLMAIAAGLVALPLLPVFGIPAMASWPYLLGSLAVHLFYYIYLAEAYRTGDLGQVYPIARGSAPLMTAIGSALIYGETLGSIAWAGVTLLTLGVVLLSIRGGREPRRIDRRAVGFAFLTAVTITTYSLIDGRGARLSESPHAYAVWLFVLDGIMMAVFGYIRQADGIRAALPAGTAIVLGGGALSLVSYWTAIWAMTVAPIALVAAVRETSVLFAALLGMLLLREPVVGARILAAVLVTGGLTLIRLH